MNHHLAARSLVVAGVLALSGPVFAETPSSAPAADTPKADHKLSAEDKKFMEDASRANYNEIELGALAKGRAVSEDVKSYSDMIVADHQKAQKSLEALAAEKNVKIPEKADVSKSFLKKLEGEKGARFDAVYMQHMATDHAKDVAEFKRRAALTKDPDLKKWADDMVPVLEKHLADARKIEAAEKGAPQPAHAK